METLKLSEEQNEIYQKKVVPTLEAVTSLTIRNNDDNLACQELVLKIKTERKKVYEMFHTPTSKAHDAWKAAKALENYFIDPFERAESAAKRKSTLWVEAEDRKRKLDEQRIEAERLDREDKAAQKLNERADKQEEKGNTAQADTLREQSESAYVAPKQASAPVEKAKGISYKDKWRGEVKDIFALLQAIIDKKIAPTVIKVDQGQIDSLASQNKNMIAIPGVRVYSEKIMSGRA